MEKDNCFEMCNIEDIKFDLLGFLFGTFLVLWGISELLGPLYWWASAEFLWPVFLIGSGVIVVLGVIKKALLGEERQ